jgi:hypothetical protein
LDAQYDDLVYTLILKSIKLYPIIL